MTLCTLVLLPPNVLSEGKERYIEPVKKIEIPKIVVPLILQKIGGCESPTGQFDTNGNVVRGKIDHDDTGKYQINRRYHLAEAIRLGYDIDTEKGNESYALYLYKTQGTEPWNASRNCWLV